jgi:ketoreductase
MKGNDNSIEKPQRSNEAGDHMKDNKGKTIVVTGAGTGIGKSIAIRLAKSGINLVLIGRRKQPLDDLAQEVESLDATAYVLECDVRNSTLVSETVAKAVSRFGGVDVLVNNAGVSGGGPTVNASDSDWNDILATNLTGTFYVTREVLRQGGMASRRWGRIIFISSTGGKQGVPHGAAYSASKGGLIALAKSLGKELASDGITVNAVCPGFVDNTQMASNVRDAMARIYAVTPDVVCQRILSRIPIQRYVQPDEVAAFVEFLVSDNASAITLQALNICGGLGIF